MSEFATAIVLFQISTLKSIKIENFIQNKEPLNVGLKPHSLGNFGRQF